MECRVLANALVPLPLQGTTKPRWPLRRFGEKGRETEEARVAGERFFESLVRLKQRGILSAKHVCILAHQASAAGAAGPCNRLAKKDGLGSGKYSQHFDAVVGSPAKQKYYVADVHFCLRHAGKRSIVPHPLQLPHEILAEQFARQGARMETAPSALRADLPACHAANPVFREPAPAIGSPSVFPYGTSASRAGPGPMPARPAAGMPSGLLSQQRPMGRMQSAVRWRFIC